MTFWAEMCLFIHSFLSFFRQMGQLPRQHESMQQYPPQQVNSVCLAEKTGDQNSIVVQEKNWGQ
jgi:hypothetical protein